MRTDTAMGARGTSGSSDSAPVFVAGADRSGTTLMLALLASHPDISMVRRTNMWRYFHRRYGNLGQADNLERCLSDMVRYRRMRRLQPNVHRIRSEFLEGEPTYGRLFALFHEHNAERAGKRRWGDKSLHTEHYASRVFAEFPNARIVHMVRDPRDRYASVRRRYGRNISRVGAATGRWLTSTHAGRRHIKRNSDRYLLVRYEDLVRDPESTMRRVCAHIGSEYSPHMLSMDGIPEYRDAGGNSSFGDLVPGAISIRAIGRFRDVLSASELAFIELVAGRDLAELGYERAEVDLAPLARLRFFTLDLPVNLARMIGWIALARLRRWRGVRVPAFRQQGGDEKAGAK
jgi:Sulfotransferase family